MEEAPHVNSSFLTEKASSQLRVTCYGSSSSKTPERYLHEARNLGYILARRGHTCVNGAGSFGCMAALNDGAVAGNGAIVGVIHEMWLVDGSDWESKGGQKSLRDGGAHHVFSSDSSSSSNYEMLVATGEDLQERKRLLVENADALCVLPGGPGTWDELWEMACVRKLGLPNSLPICCIDVDGFYQPFRDMLDRAHDDNLMEQNPEDIIHFVSGAEEAVRWVESVQQQEKGEREEPEKREKHHGQQLPTLSSFLCRGVQAILTFGSSPFVVTFLVGASLGFVLKKKVVL